VRVDASPMPDERLADEARFFRAWFENPLRTGAVSPSGRFLARMMASYVDPASAGLIIELGPGTGPVTQALIKRGVAPERLVLIEYDQAFCRLLRRRFPRCRVVQGDAYNLAETLRDITDGPVAAVVSSLPLLTRPEPERMKLLDQAFKLMGAGGSFVQFTYGMASPVPKRAKDGGLCPFAAEVSPAVWLNLPPARVWIYRQPDEAAFTSLRARKTLIVKFREHTDKVRVDFRETRDRVECKLRSSAKFAQREIAFQTKRVRDDRSVKPALALLKKLREPRKRIG
jgi:phosphatidylethanolamine/phosphatidyl-N-methylethanolamine N-methyltransferase